jgi:cell division protein FtsW
MNYLSFFKKYIHYPLYRCLFSIDRITFGIILLLLSISAFDLMTSLHLIELRLGITKMILFKKHLIFMALFISGSLFLSQRTPKTNIKVAIVVGIIGIFLCILILIIGKKTNGAKRWMNLFFFSLQPSVFIKNTIGIFLFFLGKNLREQIVILLISSLIVLFQPDFGMFLLILSIGFTQLLFIYNEELKEYSYIVFIIFGVLGVFLIFKGNYFLLRFKRFFSNEGLYQSNIAMYNIKNSLFFNKSSKVVLIPDSQSDFIFTSIISNNGIIMGVVIIILFITLFLLNIQHIRKVEDKYKIIIYGIISQIAYQSIFHMMSNLSFIPPKGVNCPFLSFGGSELLASIFSIGTLLSITKKR